MITKKQVIREVLRSVQKALGEKLEAKSYSEYLKGSVSFRLDLIPGPQKFAAFVDLPSRKEPKTLQVEFKRRYTRRRFIEVPPETVEELNAH